MSGMAEDHVDNFSFETSREENSSERSISKQVKDAQKYLKQSAALSSHSRKCITRGDKDERDDIESTFLIGNNKHESDVGGQTCLDKKSDEKTKVMDKSGQIRQISLNKSDENQESGKSEMESPLETRVLDESDGNQEIGKVDESGESSLDKSDEEARVLENSDENREIGRVDESDDDESFLSCRSTSECSYYRFSAELRKCDIEY